MFLELAAVFLAAAERHVREREVVAELDIALDRVRRLFAIVQSELLGTEEPAFQVAAIAELKPLAVASTFLIQSGAVGKKVVAAPLANAASPDRRARLASHAITAIDTRQRAAPDRGDFRRSRHDQRAKE